MVINQLNAISFYGRKNSCQSLKEELRIKDERIRQLEEENKALKRKQAEDSWQKKLADDVAERTAIMDLGSLWD